MEIKVLQFALLCEKLLSIRRDVSFYNKRTQFLIFIQVLINFPLMILNVIIYYNYHEQLEEKSNKIFFGFTILNSIITTLLACYHSGNYKVLLMHLNKNHSYFLTDKQYHKNLSKTLYCAASTAGIMFVLIMSFCFLAIVSRSSQNMDLNPYIKCFYHILMAYCYYRYLFEYISMYCILSVLAEHLDCLRRYIGNVNIQSSEGVGENQAFHGNIKIIEKWYSIHSNIKGASQIFNITFGVQVF